MTKVVSGNTFTLNGTVSGKGTLIYEWSRWNGSEFIYITRGETETSEISSEISKEWSENTSGCYSYALWFGAKGGSELACIVFDVQVLPANYAIINSETTEVLRYEYDLAHAYEDVESYYTGYHINSKIRVEKDCTDESDIHMIIPYSISLDTNGKTITRTKTIYVSGSNLTISGNGTIILQSQLSTEKTAIQAAQSGKLVISNMTIQSNVRAVSIWDSASFEVSGSYLYSTSDIALRLGTKGTTKISDTYIYTPSPTNAIYEDGCNTDDGKGGPSPSIEIENSYIGNGTIRKEGVVASPTIRFGCKYSDSTSYTTITLNNTYVMSDQYAKGAIGLINYTSLTCLNTFVYNHNDSYCISVANPSEGTTLCQQITINGGKYYTKGQHVIWSPNTANISKSEIDIKNVQLAAKSTNMIRIGNEYSLSSNIGSSSITLVHMETYNKKKEYTENNYSGNVWYFYKEGNDSGYPW